VAVVRGGRVVDGLPLDFNELDRWLGCEGRAAVLCGLVVDGDLEVDGSVLNREMDFGPFLLVTGKLTAGNMGCGGSRVLVGGDLEIEHGLFGFYNHGAIQIEGDARVPVVLSEEHLIRFAGALEAELVRFTNFVEINRKAGNKIAHKVGRQRGMSPEWLELLSPELFDWSEWRGMDEQERQEITEAGDRFDFLLLDRRAIMSWMEHGLPLLRGDRPWRMPPERDVPAAGL